MAPASDTQTARRLALTRSAPALVAIEVLASETGLHPDVIRRFVQFGLLDPQGGTRAAPLFRAQDALLLARAARLRRDLGVNYAGAVLASELLARIDELERRLRAGAPVHPRQEVTTWTRTA
jgi:chaperone modulatory protein CbpM